MKNIMPDEISAFRSRLVCADKVHHQYDIQSDGILADGVWYPYGVERIEAEMVRQRLDLKGQVIYLHSALSAYSVEHIELIDDLLQLIDQRQRLLERIKAARHRTAELLRDDSDTDWSQGVKAGQTHFEAISEGEQEPLVGYYLRDASVTEVELLSLQDQLVRSRLLMLPQSGNKVPLLVAFGFGKYAMRAIEPLRWLGKINQLHCLINLLVDARVIGCAADNKWKVAAQLFLLEGKNKQLTAKKLSDAGDINSDDERHVKRCVPERWLKKS
ncbi:MAG: hypothetical protein KBT04_07750 [Bacteroidales bacterium]|nr:hypothetical protein [Candidatus Colimorpha onthohippi]